MYPAAAQVLVAHGKHGEKTHGTSKSKEGNHGRRRTFYASKTFYHITILKEPVRAGVAHTLPTERRR